ncbi:MAG: hypothetical protein ACP5DY_02435 [Thermovirgaceae bacterium]
MKLDYLKGHMGGNLILLLDGRQIPEDRRVILDTALEALGPLRLWGHQAGILFPSPKPGHVKALIADITNRDYIPACGGFTQVAGMAFATTGWAERFGLGTAGTGGTVILETESGETRLEIQQTPEGTFRTGSDLVGFAGLLREIGTKPVDLDGIQAFQSGMYLVLDAEKVRKKHPDADFETMNSKARDALVGLQRTFHRVTGSGSLHFSLYDDRSSDSGHLRALFPHSITTGHVEPACGTGSVALALALLLSGEGKSRGLAGGKGIDVILETGGEPVLGGPDTTRVTIETDGDDILRAVFSHSLVEITSEGTVFLENS